MYNPYVKGSLIYLRHPSEEDVCGRWHEWFSDHDTVHFARLHYWPNSYENQLSFYESVKNDKNRLVLSIIDKSNDKHIGVCSLSNIDWRSRHCGMSYIIGEPEYRVGNYSFECASLLIKIAFLKLNMRMIISDYVSCHEASEKIIKVLRFKEAGRVPKQCFIDGNYFDNITIYLTKEDWVERNPEPSFTLK